jgi:hypothetical protein
MAIVINGSGTVTGLAVGGLPDGTVDAGTLATNSVDSAELIDGAVDNSHMAAMAASKLTGALPAISAANLTGIPAANITGTLPAINGASLTGLTAAQMPSGSCVQFASDFDGNFIALNSTAVIDTDLHIDFTPKFADSIIVAQAIVNVYNAGAGATHGNVDIYLNRNGGTFGQQMTLYSGYGGTEALVVGPSPIYFAESQGNTSQWAYKVQIRNVQTASGASHNQYPGYSSLYLWEIKA